MRIISESIAHDSNGFFCRLCGRAGYRSLAAVKGHLSQCPGKLIQKGLLPAQPQLPGAELGWAGAGAGNNALLQTASPAAPTAAPGPVAGPVAGSALYEMQQVSAIVRENTQQISRMQNEYTHLLMEKNQPQYQPKQDFFSQYKGMIIMGAIILFAIILSKQSSQCPGTSTGKGVNVGDLGTKALSKLVDTGITKGVAALFK